MIRKHAGLPADRQTPYGDRTLLYLLVAVNGGFALLHLASFAIFGGVPRLFYLDHEGNLPTWWSSMQFLVASLLLALVALRTWHVRPSTRLLALLAVVLVLMSIDEVSALHERTGRVIDRLLGGRPGPLHHTGGWLFVIGIPFIAVAFVLLRRLGAGLTDAPGTARRLSLGIAVVLSGALGVEALSNFVVEEDAAYRPFEVGAYIVLVAAEEFLEMTGGSILLWTSAGLFLHHWSTREIAAQLAPMTEAEARRLRPMPAQEGGA